MVPLIDRFVEEHPISPITDIKGIIALTGYNGILGYRTDIAYKTRKDLDEYQEKFFEENPDFDKAAWKRKDSRRKSGRCHERRRMGVCKVIHGDISMLAKQVLKDWTDTQKWLDYVKPLVGDTNVIIFAFGSDLGDWQPYTSDNEKIRAYLKSMGFDIYCNVDSTQYWVQFGENSYASGKKKSGRLPYVL